MKPSTKQLLLPLLFMLALLLFQPQETQAKLLSLEVDSYQFKAKPYKRYGAVFEVWPTSWFTLGTAYEPYSYEEGLYAYDVINTQPLLVRFTFANIFLKAGLLESHQKIKRSPTVTSTKVKEQILLSGTRISAGISLELNHLILSLGMLQDSLPEQVVEFDTTSILNTGGKTSAVVLSLGVTL